ncbi:MAG: hypothetical protein H0V79_05420, partial [Actinobacteria bacterium]|nr:hypothetical protein [Actinomycetota bacterium]
MPVKRPDGSIVVVDPILHLATPGWQWATSDAAGNLTYDYQLNGIEGLYEARAYPANWFGDWYSQPVASVIFSDSAAPKNTICHSTGSASNPYQRIVIGSLAGHEDHVKDIVFLSQEVSCPSRFTLNKLCATSPGDQLPANQQFSFSVPAYNGQRTETLSCGGTVELAIGVGSNKTITETSGN